MSRSLRLHPAAQRELAEATAYYEAESAGLGDAFLAEAPSCPRCVSGTASREANVHHSGVASVRCAGETEAMRSTDLDISRLSVSERIQLAEDLWDSVAAETGELPLTEAQCAELDRRLADLERDPDAGESWPVVRARIGQRLDKAG